MALLHDYLRDKNPTRKRPYADKMDIIICSVNVAQLAAADAKKKAYYEGSLGNADSALAHLIAVATHDPLDYVGKVELYEERHGLRKKRHMDGAEWELEDTVEEVHVAALALAVEQEAAEKEEAAEKAALVAEEAEGKKVVGVSARL